MWQRQSSNQGGTTGPLLFITFANDIVDLLEKTASLKLFSDDIRRCIHASKTQATRYPNSSTKLRNGVASGRRHVYYSTLRSRTRRTLQMATGNFPRSNNNLTITVWDWNLATQCPCSLPISLTCGPPSARKGNIKVLWNLCTILPVNIAMATGNFPFAMFTGSIGNFSMK